jgi:hypothetical protein
MTSRNERRVAATAASATKAASPAPVLKGTVSSAAVSSAAVSSAQAPRPVKLSPRSDYKRLAELKEKLGDDDYMNGAILRIATVLSARLTLR